MYKQIEYVSFSNEFNNWMRAIELLFKRSLRLSIRVFFGVLSFLNVLLNGRELRRSIAPGKFENIADHAPAGHFAHFSHPPNMS